MNECVTCHIEMVVCFVVCVWCDAMRCIVGPVGFEYSNKALVSLNTYIHHSITSSFSNYVTPPPASTHICPGLADVIEEILKQKCGEAHLSNTHVVSNHMVFDNDVLVGFSTPSYHVFNKKALYAKDTSPYFTVKDLSRRRHLLLLGDSLGDTTMCEGLAVADHCKIKVGFLNDKVERLPDYLQAYDVVLLGDPDFEFVAALLEDIVAAPPTGVGSVAAE